MLDRIAWGRSHTTRYLLTPPGGREWAQQPQAVSGAVWIQVPLPVFTPLVKATCVGSVSVHCA